MERPPVPPPAPPNASSRTAPIEQPEAELTRWRFSLKALLVAMTVIALLTGLATVSPPWLAMLVSGVVWIGGASWLAVGVVFARGDRQAFCIGGAIVILSAWTQSGGRLFEGMRMLIYQLTGGVRFSQSVTAWFDLAIAVLAVAANGWFCVKARRRFLRAEVHAGAASN